MPLSTGQANPYRQSQKNPRAHKNKIGIPPPPKTQNTPPPPPKKRGILWTWVFLQKERIFPGVHKIGAALSGPRIADTNFTDTRIFLTKRRDSPCLAQGGPELRNICVAVWRRYADGRRHQTVRQKVRKQIRSPPSASPPSKASRFR